MSDAAADHAAQLRARQLADFNLLSEPVEKTIETMLVALGHVIRDAPIPLDGSHDDFQMQCTIMLDGLGASLARRHELRWQLEEGANPSPVSYAAPLEREDKVLLQTLKLFDKHIGKFPWIPEKARVSLTQASDHLALSLAPATLGYGVGAR